MNLINKYTDSVHVPFVLRFLSYTLQTEKKIKNTLRL